MCLSVNKPDRVGEKKPLDLDLTSVTNFVHNMHQVVSKQHAVRGFIIPSVFCEPTHTHKECSSGHVCSNNQQRKYAEGEIFMTQ